MASTRIRRRPAKEEPYSGIYEIEICPSVLAWIDLPEEDQSLEHLLSELGLNQEDLSPDEVRELILGPRLRKMHRPTTHRPLPAGTEISLMVTSYSNHEMWTNSHIFSSERELKNYLTRDPHSELLDMLAGVKPKLLLQWRKMIQSLSGEDLLEYVRDEYHFLSQYENSWYLWSGMKPREMNVQILLGQHLQSYSILSH